MSTQVSSLSVGLFADVESFAAGFKAGGSVVDSFLSKVAHAGESLLSFAGIATGVGAVIGSMFEIGRGIEIAGQFENAQVQLGALTGNAEVARSELAQLREFATTSPFAFPELLDASKRLIAVGVNAQSVVPLLHMIGDVAAGVGAPVGDIADIFARVGAEGSVSSRELLQFGREGIPLMQTLSAQFHTSAAGVEALAASGQIGFPQLEQAFETMTSSGGKFSGILAAQSGTLGGVLHTLTTTVEDGMGDIVEHTVNALGLRGGITALTGAVGAIDGLIVSGIDRWGPVLGQWAAGVGETFQRIEPYVVPVFQEIAGGISAAWGTVSSFVEQHSAVIGGAIAGIGGILAGAAIPATLGIIGGALTAVGVAALPLVPIVAPAIAILGAAIAPALALGAAAALIATHLNVAGIAGRAFNGVVDLVESGWGTAVGGITNGATALYAAVSGVFSGIATIGDGIWDGLATAGAWAWDTLIGHSVTGGELVSSVFGIIETVATAFMSGFTLAMDIVGYVFTHFADTAELVGVTVAADVLTMANQIEYAFTTVAPAAISWFADNWRGVFTDAFNFTTTVLGNMMADVYEVFANLPGLIKGSVNFSDIWTPLTDGFTTAMKALPEIPPRIMGTMESSLHSEADRLGKAYGDGLGATIARQQTAAEHAAKGITSTVSSAIAGLKHPPEIAKPVVPQPDPVKVSTSLSPNNFTLGITPEVHLAKIIHSGSAEAQAARFALPFPSMVGSATGPLVSPMAPALAAGSAAGAAAQFGVPSIAEPASPTTPEAYAPPTPTVDAAERDSTRQPGGADSQVGATLTRIEAALNNWLTRIEYDVRPGNGPKIASIG